jgi:CubicO group peptidase (beta-lactamase class C family)
MFLPTIVKRAPVPKRLASVTSIAREREVDPRSVGVDAEGVDAIWQAVKTLYRAGVQPAMQLCIRRRGQILLDRAIGCGGGGPDGTARCRESPRTHGDAVQYVLRSKAVTAMVIHSLDEQHLLHLDDPVCEYIPEFAKHGKEWITIRHVLTHRAGIPNVPAEVMRVELLERPDDHRVALRHGADVAPGRRLAYHAISGGFILGEIVAAWPATTSATSSPRRSSSLSASAG